MIAFGARGAPAIWRASTREMVGNRAAAPGGFVGIDPNALPPLFRGRPPAARGAGQQPSFWAALAPVPNDSFFRPVGWAFWWFCGKFLGDAPAAAHAIAALLFAWNAVLLVPALRRSGVPRGVSVASGVLFAAHPAALETVAWLSNAYSLFALGFSLAALACLPVRRRGFLGILPSLVFAALAFLSKEDTYLLPVACVLVGSRFRLRNLGSGARRAAPIFAAAAACLALRSLGLGDRRLPRSGHGAVARGPADDPRPLRGVPIRGADVVLPAAAPLVDRERGARRAVCVAFDIPNLACGGGRRRSRARGSCARRGSARSAGSSRRRSSR